MCTAMLYDPVAAAAKQAQLAQTVVTPKGTLHLRKKREFRGNFRLFERWVRFKQFVLLRSWKRKDPEGKDDNKSSILSFLFFW